MSEMTVHWEMQAIFDRLGVNDVAHVVSETYRQRTIA